VPEHIAGKERLLAYVAQLPERARAEMVPPIGRSGEEHAVLARAFFYPALRLVRKRGRNRISRALRAVVRGKFG